jgi:hypothetical protein
LLSPFQPTNFFPQDKFRIELGLKPAFGTTYENSGIHPFVISGEFIHDDEKITIKDSNTQLQFLNPCPHLSIVAGSGTTRSGSKSIDPATLAVDVGDVPAYEGIMGEHLSQDMSGDSVVSITEPKLYHLLVNLPQDQREITLRFPHANTTPVELYGIRLGVST